MREIKIEKKNNKVEIIDKYDLDKMPQFREAVGIDDEVEIIDRHKLEDDLDKMPNFQEQAERIEHDK